MFSSRPFTAFFLHTWVSSATLYLCNNNDTNVPERSLFHAPQKEKKPPYYYVPEVRKTIGNVSVERPRFLRKVWFSRAAAAASSVCSGPPLLFFERRVVARVQNEKNRVSYVCVPGFSFFSTIQARFYPYSRKTVHFVLFNGWSLMFRSDFFVREVQERACGLAVRRIWTGSARLSDT